MGDGRQPGRQETVLLPLDDLVQREYGIELFRQAVREQLQHHPRVPALVMTDVLEPLKPLRAGELPALEAPGGLADVMQEGQHQQTLDIPRFQRSPGQSIHSPADDRQGQQGQRDRGDIKAVRGQVQAGLPACVGSRCNFPMLATCRPPTGRQVAMLLWITLLQ